MAGRQVKVNWTSQLDYNKRQETTEFSAAVWIKKEAETIQEG